MRAKTVLAVAVLSVIAAVLLAPAGDMSDAASERWVAGEIDGMSVEYDGGSVLTIRLSVDPGEEPFKVNVDEKVLVTGGRASEVNLGVGGDLDSGRTHLIVARGGGWSASCTLRFASVYSVDAEAVPAEGGSVVGSGNYVHGTFAVLEAAEAPGYLFDGWYIGETKVSSQKELRFAATEDISYAAKFVKAMAAITFDTDGGSPVDPISLEIGAPVTAPAAPTKEGFAFAGWEPALPAVMPAEDMTVKAVWRINTCTITFDTDGGSPVDPISAEYGSAISAPAAPTREGFAFAGWEPALPAVMPDGGLSVSALWAIDAVAVEDGRAVVVIEEDSGRFVVPEDASSITVSIGGASSVSIPDASSIADRIVFTEIVEIEADEEIAEAVEGPVKVYEFTLGVDGDRFEGPMQVTLPYAPEKDGSPVVYWKNGSALVRMPVVSSTGDSVTFETDHNSIYIVASETPAGDSGDDQVMLLAGIGAIAALALIGAAALIWRRH